MGKSNSFTFKQFSIQQEKAAMKVGTDGVLLGAWADVKSCTNILDVGTGTGLIALMLAQRVETKITGIEIEHAAAHEAKINVQNSPWPNKIDIEHVAFQDFGQASTEQFDLIVSNPPFFANSLKANDKTRNLARHTDFLPFSDLILYAAKLLSAKGRLALIIPTAAFPELEKLAKQSRLFLLRRCDVYPRNDRPLNRTLLEFGKSQTTVKYTEITVYKEAGKYSDEFKELTKAFYLKH